MTPPPAFNSAPLRTDCNGVAVQLLAFPRSNAPLFDKVQALACFEEIIQQHWPQLTALTVQQAHADNVPGSSSASAAKEANRTSCKLHNSFFHVANLTCLGFFTCDGKDSSHRALTFLLLNFLQPLLLLPSALIQLTLLPPPSIFFFNCLSRCHRPNLPLLPTMTKNLPPSMIQPCLTPMPRILELQTLLPWPPFAKSLLLEAILLPWTQPIRLFFALQPLL